MTNRKMSFSEGTTKEEQDWWIRVCSWEIIPLQYMAPSDLCVTINKTEYGLIDWEILSDKNLTSQELHIYLRIVMYYPCEFDWVAMSDYSESERHPEFKDLLLVEKILLSLEEKGYIRFGKLDVEVITE